MFFSRVAIFAAIATATRAENIFPRAVNCNSVGSVGTAASSYCSSILHISAVTILESVTVKTVSASNPTIVHTLTSTKTATGSIVTTTGTVVTYIQTKTATITQASCHTGTALHKRAKKSTTTKTTSTKSSTSSSASPKCSTAPAGLQSFACRDLSSACSCLHLPTHTVSSTSTISSFSKTTSVKTSTSVKIVTTSIKGTITTVNPTHTLTTIHTSTITTCLCAFPTPNLCSGSCVDFNSDPDHCGACNNPCPDGAYCGGGDCVCPIDTSLCPNGCVDTFSDPENCGECDNSCDEGSTCCRGTCVDLTSDDANCGLCGHDCLGTSMYCLDSSCTCQSPYGNCDGVCTDLTTWENCGICGNTCNEQAGLSCYDGKSCSCNPDDELQEMLCDGKCVPTYNYPPHCGSCGNVCPEYYYCLYGNCYPP